MYMKISVSPPQKQQQQQQQQKRPQEPKKVSYTIINISFAIYEPD